MVKMKKDTLLVVRGGLANFKMHGLRTILDERRTIPTATRGMIKAAFLRSGRYSVSLSNASP
jgi:hypothetical protein